MWSQEAVVAGHLCLDIIPDLGTMDNFFGLLQPGRLIEVGPVAMSTGGAVSNTGLALNKLGISTRLVGKIGDDLFGQAVQQIVRSFGPELVEGLVVDRESSTSYTLIASPPNQDRMFLHHVGANCTFVASDVDFDQAEQVRWFHLGYPPLLENMYLNDGLQLALAYYRAKAKGLTTSLDMSLPDPNSPAGRLDWRPVLSRTLRFVDVFLPSIEEILFMVWPHLYYDMSSRTPGNSSILPHVSPDLLSMVSQHLMVMGAKIVVLKLGDRGLYLRTTKPEHLVYMGRGILADPKVWGSKEMWAPCFQANLVGTTGSGDSTIAGFIVSMMRGLPPEEALTAALAVGACNVEAADALSGLHSWDKTMQRVADGWPRHEMSISTPGWCYDSDHQLWYKPSAS